MGNKLKQNIVHENAQVKEGSWNTDGLDILFDHGLAVEMQNASDLSVGNWQFTQSTAASDWWPMASLTPGDIGKTAPNQMLNVEGLL